MNDEEFNYVQHQITTLRTKLHQLEQEFKNIQQRLYPIYEIEDIKPEKV
ncbi:hypothetical protein [Candidatus Jettenia sp. AMX1]|nr:hypothetical protein [Candidatus Jettenia sp. AMX1]GIL19693.1 MAG: hypothetical protein BroJett041_08070 [Candidatus Jettenia caeni]GJQ45904.1 MAG: hypothetical protein JETCAE04_16580 [Candidatus Jettenia caeni]